MGGHQGEEQHSRAYLRVYVTAEELGAIAISLGLQAGRLALPVSTASAIGRSGCEHCAAPKH